MSVLSLFVCAVLVSQAAAYCSQTAYSAAGPFSFPLGASDQIDLHLPQWNGYLGPNAVWAFSFDINHSLVSGDVDTHVVLSRGEFFTDCTSSSGITITIDASGADTVLCLNSRCGTKAIVAGSYVSCNVTVDHTDVHLCVAGACDLVTGDFSETQQVYDQNFQIGGGSGTDVCNPLGGSLRNIRLCHDCQSVSGCSGVVISTCSAATTQLCTPNMCTPSSCITGNSTCVQGFGDPACRCNNAGGFYGFADVPGSTSASTEANCEFIPAPNALTTANCTTSLNGFWSLTVDPYSADSYPDLYLLGGPALRDGDTETGIATESGSNSDQYAYVGWNCYKKPISINISCMAPEPNGWGCQYAENVQVNYLDPVTGSFVHAFNVLGIQDLVYEWKVFDLTPYPPSTTWQFQSSDANSYVAIGEINFAGGNNCEGFGNEFANCAAAQGGSVCACNSLNCAYYCNNGVWTKDTITLPPPTHYTGGSGNGGVSSSSSTTQGGGGATHSSSSSSTGNGGGGAVTHSSSSSTGNGGGGAVTHSSSSSTGNGGGNGNTGNSTQSSTGDNGGNGGDSGDASSHAAALAVVALVQLAVVSWL